MAQGFIRIGLAAGLVGALVSAWAVGPAQAISPLGVGQFGFGLYGGVDWPLQQADANVGPLYGVRVTYGLARRIGLEGSATMIRNTDTETSTGGTIDAPGLRTATLNMLLKAGDHRRYGYFTVGLGFSQLNLPQSGSEMNNSYNVGLGLVWQFKRRLGLDLSGRITTVKTSERGWRKHVGAIVGVTYLIN